MNNELEGIWKKGVLMHDLTKVCRKIVPLTATAEFTKVSDMLQKMAEAVYLVFGIVSGLLHT